MKLTDILYAGIFGFALAACSPKPDVSSAKEDVSPSPEVTLPPTDQAEQAWMNPYPSYCYQRVGQIGTDGNQDQPRRGEVCEVHGGGAGGYERGAGSDPRNTAVIHIAAPSIRAVGMQSFSFSLNRKSNDPKFTTGVHVMDHYNTAQMMKDNPLDSVLPDRLAFGSDLTGENSMFTHTSPDAAHLRANAGGFDFTGYEITSAALMIDTAVDVPMEAMELDFAQKAGMVAGEQYITGTLTISLIPLGSTGQQYGPTTFEFGTTIGWGYSKSLHSGK